ncbi:MAG: replication factor C small subunit [Candidatus Lokiarchaeota archaeon]|nr:replication factor C small subunit [Candidatus Lokiarchaeota archaeon]
MSIEIPWVEKYRPKTFSDIISQNIAINNIKEFIKNPDMPHMIFTGPAGTGKTSTALIIVKNFLKKEELRTNLLEVNASDTVRMDFVRNVLKNFVGQNILKDGSLKFVILDEADNIPGQVQQALRRIIEKASTNVKFILLCNYINRIIDPIISRCAVFRFVNLPREKIVERLKYIVVKEKLEIPKDQSKKFYELLFFISGGDLRKAINTLQMAVALELVDNLDLNEILKISGFLGEKTLEDLVNALKNKDFTKSKEILDSIETLDSRSFIRQLIEELSNIDIDPNKLPSLRSFIGEIDYRISQGANEQIQISALLAQIIDTIKK